MRRLLSIPIGLLKALWHLLLAIYYAIKNRSFR